MGTQIVSSLFLVAVWTVTALGAGGPARLQGVKDGHRLLLFDAARHGLTPINNYTARWKKDSDLVPTARQVGQGAETGVEFAFRGRQGMACSTLFFNESPPPDAGTLYRGIDLEIDCDRSDYPHISVGVSFSDQSQLTHDLTLERGRHVYHVEQGFRREKHPPPWRQLAHIMINLSADRHPPDLVYRLRRITMPMVPADPQDLAASAPVPDRFAELVLSPRPKQIAIRPGGFSTGAAHTLWLDATATNRTRRTAALFADRYAGFTGRNLALKTCGNQLPADGIVLQVRATAGGGKTASHPQGYQLTIEPGRVQVAGNDEPGLYYGTVTFFQLLQNALKRPAAQVTVPCIGIVDWPDTPNRLIRLEHPHTFRNYPVRENRGIDYLIDWTERFVAGNKFNTFYIDFSANVRYQRRPEFNGTDKLYSLDDLRRFGQFCRDRFIDLCPAWQIGGHANWWLTIGYHPELREKGWKSQGDVTHPDHDAIVRDCMLDVIEALQPKYVSPKSDEWWHERKEDETPDELLHGRTRAEAFLQSHVRLNEWLHERGITMMIYEDMLSPYHNGKRFDVWRVIDQFPKDIILTLWSSGRPDKEIGYFTDRGFRVWPNATGMFTLGADAKRRVMGFGKGLYSFGNDKAHLLDEYSPLWSMSNLLRVADYAWNFGGEEEREPGRLVALEHLLAIRPNPRAGSAVEPLALNDALTTDFGSYLKSVKPETYARHDRPLSLPEGVRDIGFIPMRLGPAGHNCAVLSTGAKPVMLPVRGRYSSLVFLHAGFINNPADKNVAGVRIREWNCGWPCGNYVVHYADGSQAVLPLRLTNNIKRFDTASATRGGLDVRYAWPTNDANGQPVHLFQWEWVNPHPEREIVRVTAEHDNLLEVSLIVFAVSGRGVRETR